MTKLNFQKNNWSECIILPADHKGWVITLGVFDGVHLGHDFLLQNLKEKARQEKLNSGIVTFYSHPQKIIQEKEIQEIYSFSQKKEIFTKKGLNSIFFLKFDERLAQTSAVNFLSTLCNKIAIRYFFVGYDFLFGKNKEGTIDLLKKFSYDNNFKVVQLDAWKNKGIISSSLIRERLLEADFEAVNFYLGRKWSINSVVVAGKKLAHQLGFPTINLELDFYPPLQKGVYVVEVIVQGKKYQAVANYGVAPSIKNIKKAILECYLLNFNDNIYGYNVQVFFYKFLRAERKFKNLNLLKKQIVLDIQNTINYFQKK